MKKIYCKVRQYIPLWSLIVLFLGVLSLIIYTAFRNNIAFADFFNKNISAPFRMGISTITAWIPFSLAESLIILSPILLVILILLAVKYGKQGRKQSVKYLFSLLSVLVIIFITFVWTYSSGYYTTSIEKKLDLEKKELSADDLYQSAVYIRDKLNELSDDMIYDETGASVMPYSYDTMSSLLNKSYRSFSKETGVVRTFPSRIKPIILSEKMTYTHLSGVYSYMTGETNVNVNYPDYIVASTSAHEMAHQRGIARENEANFVAFLICINSEDKFLQYSGYLDVYSYIMNALYSADKDLYMSVYNSLDFEVKKDRYSYSQFFKKYQDSTASEVTNKVNESYLQANGQTEGTRSYGLVTDLVACYIQSLNKD